MGVIPRISAATGVVLSVAMLGACAEDVGTDLTEAQGSAMRDSVGAFVESIPVGLASEGPSAWLEFFDDAPTFFMASDGAVAFPSRDSAEVFLESFAARVAEMSLEWEDTRIIPLAPGIAAIGASYRESISFRDGSLSEFSGYVSGVARNRAGRWRLQHLHWSRPVPSAG